MNEKIMWIENTLPKDKSNIEDFLSLEHIKKARSFHSSFPQYEKTPLVALDNLSRHLELGGIFVKDESYRFGLNAFKVLGGSYAMAKFLARKLNKDIESLSYNELISPKVKAKLGDITFVTATDGNHGRGVAWTANKLQQKSVVYMPKGSSPIRLENIRKEGSDASITDMNYDEAVRLAGRYAEKYNGVVVQDTAWEGYEEIPTWIMEGYGTMALEASEQLIVLGVNKPTHLFIQAGVGSLAGAVAGFFKSVLGEDCPKIVVVEASEAACLYKSALAGDGTLKVVDGDMPTIMAGLACGEGNTIAWKVLKNETSIFVSCPDYIAANGMRILGNPLKGDLKITSGESGAVTLGLLYEIMTNSECRVLKEKLELNKDSKVLLFSTEGDTDPVRYREIVWEGKVCY